MKLYLQKQAMGQICQFLTEAKEMAENGVSGRTICLVRPRVPSGKEKTKTKKRKRKKSWSQDADIFKNQLC
jgi:hypothetical protein